MSNSTAALRLLWLLLAVEVCVSAYFLVHWQRQPLPPQPTLAHLHPATQSQLRMMREVVVTTGQAQAWRELGEAYLAFGMPVESAYCSRQAAQGGLETDRTLYLWGLALHQEGKMAEAIERFERAAKLTASTPDSRLDVSTCWYAIGRNRLRQEQASQAEAAFRNAGTFPPAQHQRIRIQVRSGRMQAAIALLDPLITRYPVAAKLYQLRADAREALGDAPGAAADRERAERSVEFLPADFIVQELHQQMDQFGLSGELAACQERLMSGQLEVAAPQLRALLAARWHPRVALLLSECELQLRRGPEAVALVDRLIEMEGVSARLLNIKARALLVAGEERQAVETWQRSARIQPTKEAHGRLTEYFAKSGDATAENDHRSRWLLARGLEAYRIDQIADAVPNLKNAVALDDQLDQAWYYLALCQLGGGMTQRAEEALARCLAANPNHGRALRLLATIQSSPTSP